ncbi:hypothetical protein E4T42_04502 [Aureobasidium subglaciale]|uniref:Uncharacterized protein n=1 Tax=Aureobasidium subglaciale (strain EXF-2481) TaxID=1043005 RepID=A0A074YCK3_AURSE|nr:uncharacterized protein AUEXF2481DRAFT_43547 [Aureobasidium subglaciale EXF-2481]KAI5204020.1 hypothetical protein E4T38_04827 [Aureobasidium subglaciale]KAI5222844.1 hypothetical protein E4T40_04741 [Aureobasidium subglaciale]KAI5226671.1 hypothetical protein E4T41_04684 [Aureobasidium subglaciale]KAI5251157.1 hypothetical protein E4T42_04502 [Aureobasidium subglaciale]KAI5263082.1 hypothetical protein E4T46_03929 [Aureobasidium subglaciale]
MAAVQSLLKPVFALVGWTFAMEGWMYATRLPAMSQYKIKTDSSFSKEKLNNQIPASVRWKGKSAPSQIIMLFTILMHFAADNYDHLHEAPTRFYAVALGLALYASTSPAALTSKFMASEAKLAWVYVGLRVVHSVVQASANPVMVRFSIFVASEVTMLGLLLKGVSAVWQAKGTGSLI